MTVLFSAHSLSHSIDGNDIFTDMSFDVKTGTITEIRGDNGSGKSSLLKILCGLIKSNSLDVQQDVIGDISYSCGATTEEIVLPDTLKSVGIRSHSCDDPIEKIYYSAYKEDPVCIHCGSTHDLTLPDESCAHTFYPYCSSLSTSVPEYSYPAKL